MNTARTKSAKNIPRKIPRGKTEAGAGDPGGDAEAPPFASWLAAMGFNRKQVADAGAKVGVGSAVAGKMNRGERKLTELERLGLTAAYFGLPPWSADVSERVGRRAATLIELAREEIARKAGG